MFLNIAIFYNIIEWLLSLSNVQEEDNRIDYIAISDIILLG